jgi:tetratricopeptide (TPR) repeat protein
MTNQTALRYKAFISYSHAADGRLAPALQHAVQVFTKPWYALRACRVFRDDTTLSVTSALWPSIEKALLDAEFFVLLASPAAAGSEWVSRELQRWCEVREVSRILIVLTDGAIAWDNHTRDFDWTTTTALPRILEKTFAEQPLYLDLRWAKTTDHLSRRQPKFLEAVADLSCSLRGLSKDELLGMEVRQHMRTRRIIIGAVTTLLALTIAAVVASVQLFKALEVAEERRVQARGVAETIVYEVQDSLANVPEATEAKKRLTAKAEALVLALDSARSDLRLKRAQLVQHSQRADEAIAEGRPDLARAALTKSLALAKDLAAHDAMNSALRRDVSVCLNKLGKLLLAAGDPHGALPYFEEELEIAQELASRSPGDLRSRNDLAMAQENVGKALLASGKLAEASAVLGKDLTLMRELHAEYPTNDDVTHGLAAALVQHGELLIAMRDRAGATANFREALVLDMQVQAARPHDVRISHAMSIAHLKLGDLAVADHDVKRAQAELEQSLRLRRALLVRAPRDLAAQKNVAIVLARLGSLLIHDKQDEAGVAYMNEAIELENALLAAAAADDPLRRDLASPTPRGISSGASSCCAASPRVRRPCIRWAWS